MNGLLAISTPRFTVGLDVRGGVVVDAPPYARKMGLLGRDARQVWRQWVNRAQVAWVPDEDVPGRTAG